MARLIWSADAVRDIEEIAEYHARTDPGYARTFARDVFAIGADCADQPFFGAEVPEYGEPGLRERQYHSYRILYRVWGDGVEVVMVRHAARLLPRRPPG